VGNQIKVAIVDDDDSFLQKARASLESAGDVTLVGQAGDGQAAVVLIRETHPDIVLLDAAGYLEQAAQMRELSPARIIVLHDEQEEHLALDAFKKGALGHLTRSATRPAEIVAAIRAVSRGEAIISSGVAGRILDQVMQERKIPGGKR
jgi:DNA-binding NarL/FixJ family response regulator